MEVYSISGLSFRYPNEENLVLDNINLEIKQGEFVTLCGPSGSGKTTLLRHLKTPLAPHGEIVGEIKFSGKSLKEIDQRTQSSEIGFVMQNPDNQIVTDKVWHELAFGLESLGYGQNQIRLKVAEIASFFGIENWFYKNVEELSGGQKQILNLAGIMAMQPKVIILDEPTAQLDPIAATEFTELLGRINRELGTTVILTEHRLDEVLPLSDRMVVLENGILLAEGTPKKVGEKLKNIGNTMFMAMPVPMRIYSGVVNNLECPITVREGRQWLTDFSAKNNINEVETATHKETSQDVAVELKQLWFKYEKDSPDIIKGVDLKVKKGEFLAILGGNGTGKTTTLSLISGINKPYRGTVFIKGQKLNKITDEEKFSGLLGVLPQNPQALFVNKTVELDLLAMFTNIEISQEEKQNRFQQAVNICNIGQLLNRHPYDLSGGEQQRAALAKILLLSPEILLMDEPTKGFDAEFKAVFGEILKTLTHSGVTVIMVTHDIEFCGEYAHRCALFFDGGIVTEGSPTEFFTGNSFYTTAANRMSRHVIPNAVTVEEVIKACGGQIHKQETKQNNFKVFEKAKPKNITQNIQTPKEDRKLSKSSKSSKLAVLTVLLLIPLTIFFGIYYLGDRKYYFISMLIIIETMLPFIMIFEGRKPQARELIVVSVMCAIAVAGRSIFFMLPQFKPVAAIVILSGIAFGGEIGFLVGAVTAFVSNMYFGQGPWTPWQMFAFGIIGFLAGVLFKKGWLTKKPMALAIFGGVTVFLIYGVIMNTSSLFMYQQNITLGMILLSCAQGIPFDMVHGISTAVFLLVISKSLLEKLDRIKIKYGLFKE